MSPILINFLCSIISNLNNNDNIVNNNNNIINNKYNTLIIYNNYKTLINIYTLFWLHLII